MGNDLLHPITSLINQGMSAIQSAYQNFAGGHSTKFDYSDKLSSPTPTQQPTYHFDYTQPQATPTPQATSPSSGLLSQSPAAPQVSQQTLSQPFKFDYSQLNRDPNYAFKVGPRPGFNPNQPPPEMANLIRQFFPKEATAAAAVAASEDGRFSATAQSPVNNDGSIDRGLFGVNSNTFNGLMERQGDLLKKNGIHSYEDMFDPAKNAFVASLIKQGSQQFNPNTKGWGGWYGWQDTGYDLNNDYYSQPKRVDYELKKRGR